MSTGTKAYFSLKDYFLGRYGRRVQKITVALPFTCPNRDGSKATGGCTFCAEGSKPSFLSSRVPLRRQIEEGIERAKRKYGKNILFFIYFQSYTNTYASVETLKDLYDTVLEFEEVVGLDVGTRPDCVPEEVLDLLASYTEKGLEVWVELGLQSANFETLKRINRAHGVSDFVDGVLRVKRRSLKVCAHLIVGLPGESREDFLESVRLITVLGVDGIKIHPIYVMKNTVLGRMFMKGEFKTLALEDYVRYAADMLELLPYEVVVHRLTAEAEPDKLLSPSYCVYEKKLQVIGAIEKELERRGSFQGARQTSGAKGAGRHFHKLVQ